MNCFIAQTTLLCCRYLATGDSYTSIAASYRTHKSTICCIIPETCRKIWEMYEEEIVPQPTTQSWIENGTAFQPNWQFPNCVGAIDGKHVLVQAPAQSGSSFFNYKHTHSIVLMAVVDARYRFIYIDIGAFGRQSDGNIFQNCTLGQALRNQTLNLPPPTKLPRSERRLPFVFVGDEAFPLMENLMRPFSGQGLDLEKKIFN